MAKGDGFVMEDKAKDQVPSMIDFSSFILSLYSSGMVQLGKLEDPSNGNTKTDIGLARHTIDMISMLQEKTLGNLTEEESNLLKTLLRELRLAFVEASK